MTLGDIFGKLSNVSLMSILKWYGRIVIWGAFGLVCLFLILGLGWLLVSIISSIPWWGTLVIVLILSACIAYNIAEPKQDPLDDGDVSERHLRHTILHGTEYNAAPYNFKTPDVSEWNEIRHKILEMGDVDTITIFYKGEPFEFKNRSDALSFVDKIETENE